MMPAVGRLNSSSPSRERRLHCALLAGAILLAAGCSRKPPEAKAAKPPEVFVETPTTREVTDYEDFTGRTESVRSVELRARVTGYLETAFFKDGADVSQGDVLMEIDPRTYKAELDRAKAVVAQALCDILCMRHRFDRADIHRFHLRDQFEDAVQTCVRDSGFFIGDGDARKTRYALHIVEGQCHEKFNARLTK